MLVLKGESFYWAENYRSDIQYLLSKLEIAEKALLEFSGFNGKYPDGYECGNIAKQALQQIRE